MPLPQLTSLNLLYEGSVKNVWQPEQISECLWFEFTDDYSVFDWGKMPDQIKNKGKALATMGAYVFETFANPQTWQKLYNNDNKLVIDKSWLNVFRTSHIAKELQAKGLRTHFKRLVGQDGKTLSLGEAAETANPIYMEVLKAKVGRPEKLEVFDQSIFNYPLFTANDKERLIPLEVVFRFGMPEGSSLKDRLARDPDYHRKLGLKSLPQANQWFGQPVIEFYTKLEPKDRLLSLQEAITISQLSSQQFKNLVDLALNSALCLAYIFSEVNIDLWDGKFEFILSNDEVLLADSVGPDELRLVYKNCHLSKEIIRKFYRNTGWYQSIQRAQEIASKEVSAQWKDICVNRLKETPENLPHTFKQAVDYLYGSLTNHLLGKRIFANQLTLDDLVNQLANTFK